MSTPSDSRPDRLARMGYWETGIQAYASYNADKCGQPCRLHGTFRSDINGEPDPDGDRFSYSEPNG